MSETTAEIPQIEPPPKLPTSEYEKPAKSETVVIEKLMYLDGKSRDSVKIGRPLKKENFIIDYEREYDSKGESVELPVYAEFYLEDPNKKDQPPLRFAIVGDENNSESDVDISKNVYTDLNIATFTQSPNGDRKITRMPIVSDGYSRDPQRISLDGLQDGVEIVRNYNRFNIKKLQEDGVLKADVPVQDEISVLGEKDDDVIDVEALAAEFPKDVDFDIKLHAGSYDAKHPEEFMQRLKDQSKAAWVILAKGMGFDINAFPIDKIDLWAPIRRDGMKGMKLAMKAKEIMHRGWNKPNQFEYGYGGFSRPESMLYRRKLDMPIDTKGNVDVKAMVHELLHCYLDQEKASGGAIGYKNIIHEGLASIGDKFLTEMVTKKKMPTIAGIEENFQALKDAALNDSEQNRLIKKAYDPANAMLHWYLFSERGGIDKVKELLGGIGDIGANHGTLLNTYQSTYGESMTDLIDKAKEWYESQI